MIITEIKKAFIYKGKREGCKILVKIALPHTAELCQLNDFYGALCEKYKSCAKWWIESCTDSKNYFLTVSYEDSAEKDMVKIKRLSRLYTVDRTLFEKYSIDIFSSNEYKILS